MKILRKAMLALAGLIGLAGVPAHAAVQVTSWSYVPGSVYGGMNLGGNLEAGEAGRFQLQLQNLPNGSSFQVYSFCIDIMTSLYTFSPYDIRPGSSMFSGARGDSLAALLAHADATISAAGDADAQIKAAAAFQLAVWEVIYDDGPYSLSGGNFSSYGDFDALGVSALGQQFLANVASNAWTGDVSKLRVLVSTDERSQNQIFIGGGVPEPATWLMLTIGFGLIGASLRRKPGHSALAH